MTEATRWQRIDEPVLRWVAGLAPSLAMELHEFELREPQAFEPISGLDTRDVDASLKRLVSYGLVAGEEDLAGQMTMWSKLRVTASGWVVLGEWPDLDRVTTAASLHRLLRALAEDAPEAERRALVRAAGVVSRTADEVLRGTATDIAKTIGDEVVGQVIPAEPAHRRCTGCGSWSPLEDFPANRRMHLGVSSRCRACHRAATKDWRRCHRDEINAARRLGEREAECVDCGQPFLRRSTKAERCLSCRHERKREQRRRLRQAA